MRSWPLRLLFGISRLAVLLAVATFIVAQWRPLHLHGTIPGVAAVSAVTCVSGLVVAASRPQASSFRVEVNVVEHQHLQNVNERYFRTYPIVYQLRAGVLTVSFRHWLTIAGSTLSYLLLKCLSRTLSPVDLEDAINGS